MVNIYGRNELNNKNSLAVYINREKDSDRYFLYIFCIFLCTCLIFFSLSFHLISHIFNSTFILLPIFFPFSQNVICMPSFQNRLQDMSKWVLKIWYMEAIRFAKIKIKKIIRGDNPKTKKNGGSHLFFYLFNFLFFRFFFFMCFFLLFYSLSSVQSEKNRVGAFIYDICVRISCLFNV